jgi:hypothetical protein
MRNPKLVSFLLCSALRSPTRDSGSIGIWGNALHVGRRRSGVGRDVVRCSRKGTRRERPTLDVSRMATRRLG